MLALSFVHVDFRLGIGEDNRGLLAFHVDAVFSQVRATHHLIIHVICVEGLIVIGHDLELGCLLVERLLFGVDLCFDEGALLGASYDCRSRYLAMELLLLHRLFGNLRNNFLRIRIHVILLLLSN